MTGISDEFMLQMQERSRNYTLVLVKRATRYHEPGAGKIVWEHGRRNHSLRADGVLAIVCPIDDDTEWAGVGIFDAPPDETTRIMNGDPAIVAGVLSYQLHPVKGFPGDSLPGPKADD